MSQLSQAPTQLAVSRAMNTLLERNYWPASLEARSTHVRRHDDTDGDKSPQQDLAVTIGPDGDMWLTAGGGQTLRFRTWAGGGGSQRVHKALLTLAEAIQRDNAERPQG